jgi:tetratricopeptide (TPR) repeat protein
LIAQVHDELHRGRAAVDRGAYAEAVEVFAAALAAAPDDAEVMAWLGWARFLEAAERLNEAVALVRRARFENPQASRPLLVLAHIASRQGDQPLADKYLKEALRRSPDDPDVHAAIHALGPPDT